MTLRECWEKARKNGYDDVARFMHDMKKAGLKSQMRYYEGRYFWTGPAVVVRYLHEALSVTKVECLHDNMGLGYVVYPKQSINFAKELFGK